MGDSMTFTRAISTNNYGPSKFIVDGSTTANGTHSTISAALTSATSGDTIFIRPGTYTENLTLKAGVNLTAYGSDSSLNATGKVIILGNSALTTAGTVTISGIQLQTNSGSLLTVSGSAASIVNLQNCYLNMVDSTGITFSSSSSSAAITIQNSNGNLGTTGIAIFAHSSAGSLTFTNSYFRNTGGSSTASTVSAGLLTLFTSLFFSPITSSGTSAFGMTQSGLDTSAQNVTCVTSGGSGNHLFNESSFTSGTASAISNSNTLGVYLCYINSTNTNALTGAGTLLYQGLVFSGSSFKINTTTQTGGLLKGGQTQAPSAGFIGEQIRASATSVSLSNGTAANITSINLTAGIWDVSGIAFFNPSGNTTYSQLSINTVSATIFATVGDLTAQDGGPSLAALTRTLSIPSFRVTLTSTTTYYLVGFINFSTGSANCNGRISATRVG